MSLSYFGEKELKPTDEMLAQVLADKLVHWQAIIDYVDTACKNASQEWKYYSKSSGWTLVVKSKKRTIVYLIPQDGFSKANFVYGEKAVAAAHQTKLPKAILTLIDEATQHMEGRSFMFDIKSQADVEVAQRVIDIKHRN